MFETSSNTGAWCWCLMHCFHASALLAISYVCYPVPTFLILSLTDLLQAAGRIQRPPRPEVPWATKVLDSIMEMLGDRAKNSFLSKC
jgi:hypothetical protein